MSPGSFSSWSSVGGWCGERDAHDNRLRLLRLSELGMGMTEQMHQHMHERHAELFDRLSPRGTVGVDVGFSALKRAFQNSSWRSNHTPQEGSGRRNLSAQRLN